MIDAADFLDRLNNWGRTFVAGTPCSYLKPFINKVIDDPRLAYYDAANEGDAVALVSGAFLGGRPGVVLFQNAGLGNAVNALTSLCFPFRIPLLLIVTHRGRPGGPPDEPQHELMGEITTDLLEVLRIPWRPFPKRTDDIEAALIWAEQTMRDRNLPCALVMSKGDVSDYALQTPIDSASCSWTITHHTAPRRNPGELPLRHEIISAFLRHEKPEDIVVCTTGYTGRELYTLRDATNHLYMVGSMGSAASFSLGLALVQPGRRLVVFDGDGAVLMRLNNLALIGAHRPPNVLHVVLDNSSYESTGKQSTLSGRVCLTGIARACGYRSVSLCESVEDFEGVVAGSAAEGPALIHVRIRTGTLPQLGRPKIKPFEVKDRLMRHLGPG